jgi:type II secretory pathway pseudopilin PulG
MSARAERGPAAAGLTLLEVLAAVAVLALVYTVLAGSAMLGLRAEGESRRRLEASLLADEVLADLELALEQGAPPPPGRHEDELEGFAITTEVTPFDLPAKLEYPELETRPPSLFSGPGRASLLRRIDVAVSWQEGLEARAVVRTTFGLDREAAAPLLEGLAAEGATPAEGARAEGEEEEPAGPRGPGADEDAQ